MNIYVIDSSDPLRGFGATVPHECITETYPFFAWSCMTLWSPPPTSFLRWVFGYNDITDRWLGSNNVLWLFDSGIVRFTSRPTKVAWDSSCRDVLPVRNPHTFQPMGKLLKAGQTLSFIGWERSVVVPGVGLEAKHVTLPPYCLRPKSPHGNANLVSVHPRWTLCRVLHESKGYPGPEFARLCNSYNMAYHWGLLTARYTKNMIRRFCSRSFRGHPDSWWAGLKCNSYCVNDHFH